LHLNPCSSFLFSVFLLLLLFFLYVSLHPWLNLKPFCRKLRTNETMCDMNHHYRWSIIASCESHMSYHFSFFFHYWIFDKLQKNSTTLNPATAKLHMLCL
jgi:hypothetical protein